MDLLSDAEVLKWVSTLLLASLRALIGVQMIRIGLNFAETGFTGRRSSTLFETVIAYGFTF